MNPIAFQGEFGAYSHMAVLAAFPGQEPLPCQSFEDAFAAVEEGKADLAMIPIENSLAGRVSDVHHLLPQTPLHIVGEHFLPIRHALMAPMGAELAGLRQVRSHPMALGQCRKHLRAMGLKLVSSADTAGAAREVAEAGDLSQAALASPLAAQLHGLTLLKEDLADADHNATRFIILARAALSDPPMPALTSFVFQVRNIPAALFKALGGFATNGVNMTKLESYQLGGSFAASQFYADVEGCPQDPPMVRAFEELAYFSTQLRVLGCYPADPYRQRF
jgi:prephenate dehydratase